VLELMQIWKLRGTEELFLVLEDNRVVLSSMRSNRYHLYFATEIIKWDKDLSLLSETVEMIIQVRSLVNFLTHKLWTI
jgi:dynein heavy chain